ncbi:hypothetical protein AVEN_4776-1 [Araneus ventricosus]|uniref:Uncharacterized protein n=1 Tax=Araneus ventricosus TaxID=182803 RepID=A0A4Y2JNZ1_ARAVE|nr:hypothetical protein AVEN_4776-1 [Araneus ventricosus]
MREDRSPHCQRNLELQMNGVLDFSLEWVGKKQCWDKWMEWATDELPALSGLLDEDKKKNSKGWHPEGLTTLQEPAGATTSSRYLKP